jgi:hypothetical protein
MKIQALLLSCIVMVGCTHFSTEGSKTLERKKNAIPVIRKTFAEASEAPEEYYVLENENGTYTVTTQLSKNELGGGPSADFENESDKVLRVYFTE